jgi:hypothetical protein
VSEPAAGPRELALEQVQELAGLLRQHIKSAGSTAKAASLSLGLGPAYLSRVFRGAYALKLRHAFAILATIGERPAEFFAEHYSLAGSWPPPPAPPEGVDDAEEEELPAELSQEAVLAAGERQVPDREPTELVDKARRLVAAVLDRKGVKRRAVDRALKLGSEDRLGRALRGEADLLALHLFGTLAVVGTSPAVFFAELFAPKARQYAELLELLESVRERAGAGWRRKLTPPANGNGDDEPGDR